jgi:hypothetical protein
VVVVAAEHLLELADERREALQQALLLVEHRGRVVDDEHEVDLLAAHGTVRYVARACEVEQRRRGGIVVGRVDGVAETRNAAGRFAGLTRIGAAAGRKNRCSDRTDSHTHGTSLLRKPCARPALV